METLNREPIRIEMNVYCIFSDERAYRLKSPGMFSWVMKRHGIKGSYVPFNVAAKNLGQALHSMRILHIAGANVSVPYKEAAVSHMDVLSEGANIIGAINTIVRKDDVLKGYNTNAIGIMDTLDQAGFVTENKSALVLGTGGAAKAAAFILNWLRSDTLYLAGRNPEKAAALINRFGGQALPIEDLADREMPVDLIINATSVSDPDVSPDLAHLVMQMKVPRCCLVIDLNYGQPNNFWQEMARKNKIDFMDGLTPLAHQAKRTFALWTNMQLPAEEFVQAIEEEW